MRTLVLFDGQNLYHGAKAAWARDPPVHGSLYGFPSYDVEKLAAELVGRVPGRKLHDIRFYTGVPAPEQNAFWHGFWNNKLRYLGSRDIHVYRGRINMHGQEKGVDVSLAIDLIQLTHEQAYEAAIIVSQDADFGPAVRLAKQIAHSQSRMLQWESAFVVGGEGGYQRGVPKDLYDRCIDPTDYRA